MIERFDIAGYARISVDDEQDQKNISIENQKAIIEDYVKTHFPGSTLTFFFPDSPLSSARTIRRCAGG